MALPTAQLGALPNLSNPGYIPVTAVHKEPALWKQALLQLVTAAGTTAATEGVKNEFAQENAQEFGKDPRGVIAKFMNGPTVGDREAIQLRDISNSQSLEGNREAAAAALQDASLGATAREDELNRGANADTAARDRALREYLGEQSETGANTRLGISEAGSDRRANAGNLQRMNELAFTDTLKRQDPLYLAQTTDAQAQAQQRAQEAEKGAMTVAAMKKYGLGGGGAGTGQPTAALQSFATPTTPRQQGVINAASDPTRYGEFGKVHDTVPQGNPVAPAPVSDIPPDVQRIMSFIGNQKAAGSPENAQILYNYVRNKSPDDPLVQQIHKFLGGITTPINLTGGTPWSPGQPFQSSP